MAREGIPINPAIVTWARQRAGMSAADAATKFSHLASCEVGETLPSYAQLERMADEFRLPVAVFFFPDIPKVSPIRESFRTLPDTEFDRLPRRIAGLLRKGKAFQLNLAELNQGQNPAPRLITRDLDFTGQRLTVEVMATRVRDYLGVTLEQQAAWPSDDGAFKAWRKILVGVGIFVFKDAFREDGYSGFSLYDHVFPIIYVNNSSATTRQIFTLFHELAHLIYRTSGIDPVDANYVDDLPDRQKRIEVLCNRFAAQFLMPQGDFNKALAGRAPSESTAEGLAERFHVSREVIFRMFLDRGLIKQADYKRAVNNWAEQKQTGSGGDHYWNKRAYLGRDYVALAFSKYHQNRIDDVQLGEYLDMRPRNLSRLEEYFSKSSS